jgi:uncharacterized protein (TIGR03435 family)
MLYLSAFSRVHRRPKTASVDFSLRSFDPDSATGEIGPKGDMLRQMDNGLSASLKDLGLKLESQRNPVEMLVIDHVERPSEN